MSKGDIVLIPFPFTDLTGSKLRPSLILNETNSDVMVSFITTQLQWQEPTDILLYPSPINGIKRNSLIRLSKIATIERKLVVGKMGIINNAQFNELNTKLKNLLRLQ